MRITNSMMSDQFLREANASLNRLSDAQSIVDSKKKINGIADDPLGTISSLKARNKLSSLANYQSSISAAGDYLKENSNAAESLNKVVQSAYELMVSAKSAKTDDDLGSIADEVSGLRDEVLSIANSTLGTNYLFSGNSTEKPFSIDDTTGHLMYNGLDLTKYSLNEEYQNDDQAVTDAAAAIDDLAGGGLLSELSSSSDYYAKNTVCTGIISQLDHMITNLGTAMNTAKSFGKDILGNEVDISGLKSASEALTSIKKSLESEASKDLYEGPGAAPNDLTFSTDRCESILSKFTDLLNGTGAYTESLSTVLGNVRSQMDVSNMDANLTIEKNDVKKLQIGSDQSIQVSANGLELMGTGTSNVYYVLDKCVNILNGKLDKSLLSDVPAALQSSQSNLLSLETKIGTTQNRLSMISDRYTSSKSTYTEMKSDAEDADMAEAIVNLTTAKTVYNAALAAGSKIVQTSLVDFLH